MRRFNEVGVARDNAPVVKRHLGLPGNDSSPVVTVLLLLLNPVSDSCIRRVFALSDKCIKMSLVRKVTVAEKFVPDVVWYARHLVDIPCVLRLGQENMT